jgi:hypothetical protein
MKPPESRNSKRVLLNERPLVLLPSLAKSVGVSAAIAVQQLHFYLADPRNGNMHEGKQWIFKTYEDWERDDFPFWSPRTIRRTFSGLEKKGLIVSCQPEGRRSRRKHYRIDYDKLEAAVAKTANPSGARTRSGQSGRMEEVKSGASLKTETTTEKRKGEGRLAQELQDRPPLFYPKIRYPYSEDEMYGMLEKLGIEIDPDHDGNFFKQMEYNDWTINGEPIWDWPAVYKARLEVTSP